MSLAPITIFNPHSNCHPHLPSHCATMTNEREFWVQQQRQKRPLYRFPLANSCWKNWAEIPLPGINPMGSLCWWARMKDVLMKLMKNLYIFPELLWCSNSLSLQGWKTVKNWQAGLLWRSNKAARHCQNHARASCSQCLRFYSTKNEAPMEAFGRGLLLKAIVGVQERAWMRADQEKLIAPLSSSHTWRALK